MNDGVFGIKLVWPGYFEDPLAYERMGFPRDSNNRFDIPINSKMLVYVTEFQLVMAVSKVTGTWEEGNQRYSPTGKFPLCLPIETPFRSEYGLSLREVQKIVPRFRPHQGLSYFPISEAEFIELEGKLHHNG
jgi:hypothetical protein